MNEAKYVRYGDGQFMPNEHAEKLICDAEEILKQNYCLCFMLDKAKVAEAGNQTVISLIHRTYSLILS
jgi:predicted adenine nucleotide alpha hydrolase (AANH) superfamily ATPase